MTREEMQMTGFEIVAYAGDARSKLLILLSRISSGDFTGVEEAMVEIESLINHAHTQQMEILASEAQGGDIEYSFTMAHAQDHLMTVITMKEMAVHIIKLYEKLGEK